MPEIKNVLQADAAFSSHDGAENTTNMFDTDTPSLQYTILKYKQAIT
jgi:hypothetical protein